MEIPELDKTYDCFDDGKVTESRKYKALTQLLEDMKNEW
jgi:hypothetical protein